MVSQLLKIIHLKKNIVKLDKGEHRSGEVAKTMRVVP